MWIRNFFSGVAARKEYCVRIMAREKFFEEPRRVNIIIERKVHDRAIVRARNYGLRGGFSEYVCRLIVADIKTKGLVVVQVARRRVR